MDGRGVMDAWVAQFLANGCRDLMEAGHADQFHHTIGWVYHRFHQMQTAVYQCPQTQHSRVGQGTWVWK